MRIMIKRKKRKQTAFYCQEYGVLKNKIQSGDIQYHSTVSVL